MNLAWEWGLTFGIGSESKKSNTERQALPGNQPIVARYCFVLAILVKGVVRPTPPSASSSPILFWQPPAHLLSSSRG